MTRDDGCCGAREVLRNEKGEVMEIHTEGGERVYTTDFVKDRPEILEELRDEKELTRLRRFIWVEGDVEVED